MTTILSFVLSLFTFVVVIAALFLVSVPIVPIYYVLTIGRRARCRARLRSLGWPTVWVTPDLLSYPDSAWKRLPTFEEAQVTPALEASAKPRALLKETLRLLSPEGWQWARM